MQFTWKIFRFCFITFILVGNLFGVEADSGNASASDSKGKGTGRQGQPADQNQAAPQQDQAPGDESIEIPPGTDDHVLPTDPLNETCRSVPPEDLNEPLKCFHCESNTREERNALCDSVYWKHLRQSERARFRQTCDTARLRAKFCIKIIKQKYLERITTRGCFGESIQTSNGTLIRARNGCHKFYKNGYITHACFCDRSFCNDAPGFQFGKTISLVCFLLGLFRNNYF